MPGHRRRLRGLRRRDSGRARCARPSATPDAGRRRWPRDIAKRPGCGWSGSWRTRRRSPGSATTRPGRPRPRRSRCDAGAVAPRADRAARPRSSTPSARSPTSSSSTAAAPAPSRRTAAEKAVTEVAAGSGLFQPAPVRLLPRASPAARRAVRPARRAPARPRRGHRARRRLPRLRGRRTPPAAPAVPARRAALHAPTRARARCRPRCSAQAADDLRVGDRVWFRHAKAGELCERFATPAPRGGRPGDRGPVPDLPRRGPEPSSDARARPRDRSYGRRQRRRGPQPPAPRPPGRSAPAPGSAAPPSTAAPGSSPNSTGRRPHRPQGVAHRGRPVLPARDRTFATAAPRPASGSPGPRWRPPSAPTPLASARSAAPARGIGVRHGSPSLLSPPVIMCVISLSGRPPHGTAGGQVGFPGPNHSEDTMTSSSPATPPPTSPCPTPTATRSRWPTYRGRRVILYFYPAAMTPGCTKQACDFRDNLASLTAAGFVGRSACPRTSRPSWPKFARAATR